MLSKLRLSESPSLPEVRESQGRAQGARVGHVVSLGKELNTLPSWIGVPRAGNPHLQE